MDTWEILKSCVLGLAQGLTEFLPVSSSGHVALFSLITGGEPASIGLQLIVHLGTLLATVVGLRYVIAELLGLKLHAIESEIEVDHGGQQPELRRTLLLIVATNVPTAIIGLLLRAYSEAAAASPVILAICFFISALIMFSTRAFERNADASLMPNIKQAVLIGVAQGLAVMPGISRSGATIATALALGMGPRAAFRWSFLASLPAIGGAFLLELLSGRLANITMGYVIAGFTAFFVGLLSYAALKRVVVRGRLWLFGLYLVLLSAAIPLLTFLS